MFHSLVERITDNNLRFVPMSLVKVELPPLAPVLLEEIPGAARAKDARA